MIRSGDGFRKVLIGGWIAVSVPFVVLGFIAGPIFGLAAIAIALGGLFSDRFVQVRRRMR